jgi:DNA-binding SARP family transcriptional activator
MVDRDALLEPPSGTLIPLRHAGRGLRPAETSGQPAIAVGPGRWGGDPTWRPAAERTVDQYPVSRAKVTPPPLRETTLSRDRLLDWLGGHAHRRCVTVVAETGFGKTTLLADFTRRTPARCLWYRLDTGDRDPISFANYLVAAGREAVPSFGVHTLALLREMLTSRPSTELILSTLIAEMTALGDRSTILVLDDYHVVDEDPRARALMTRLLAEAPDRMSFVLLSRRPPRLALGRLVARGEAPHLDADDLRFSADETERLFRDVYRQPLEPEVLRKVEVRTEGWAAGLQLLHSSIRGRSPRDVRSFVEAISGAEGPLYDYLAEEVLADFEPEIQRFLTNCSILDDVTVELAQAIFATDDPPVSAGTIRGWAQIGHRSGLMTRHSELSTNLRYHPLMREFLERRLGQLVTPEELRGMHLRVARVAEATDWLASCRHYIKAGCEDDALRVLAANATKVLGSGQWGDGAELIHALRASDEDPRIAVILAREDIYGGRIEEGLSRLERFDLSALDGPTRGLVVQARVHALWWLGRTRELQPAVESVMSDQDVPEHLREIAAGILVTMASTTDGSLRVAETSLESLAAHQERDGMPFYAAISRHNLMFVRLFMGDFRGAIGDGERALELLARLPGVPEEIYPVQFGLARAFCELGDYSAARTHLERAVAGSTMGAVEQWFEAAALLPVLGDVTRSKELLGRGLSAPTSTVAQNQVAAMFAETRYSLLEGRFDLALDAMGTSYEEWVPTTTCAWASWLEVRCVVQLAARDYVGASSTADAGLVLAKLQGSKLLEGRFLLGQALASRSAEAVDRALEHASDMDLLMFAEALTRNLHLIGSAGTRIRDSIAGSPARWLPLLRRLLADPSDPSAVGAAALLEDMGEMTDVRLLRSLAKTRVKSFRGTDVGRALARRQSPRLQIHDLGRSRLNIGSRSVELSEMRRRSAGLLCFLLTRKRHTATRDQVLEALWPDTDPAAAVNSLNQTLYFLRRDIDPTYDDDYSAPYVHFESDLVWLDAELTAADSQAFHERATRAMATPGDVDEAEQTLALYGGRFAPEFEYEEWASGWRELLHAQYLHLGETLVARLIRDDRMWEAAELAVGVLHVDSGAEHLERELIWLYGALGARSAAAEQYGHYAEVQRAEYGVEPLSLEAIMSQR